MPKNWMNLLKSALLLLLLTAILSPGNHTVYAEIPPYAKWGQLAMQKTKEKYPNAEILDYLHLGRETKDNTSIERFRLWLKMNDKEFPLLVEITFNTQTEQLIDITFSELPD